jgi:hypothetical protein
MYGGVTGKAGNRLPMSISKRWCHSEPFAVILSEAKDLALVRDEARTKDQSEILRFAQNDRALMVSGARQQTGMT